jgi:hypothetical protein
MNVRHTLVTLSVALFATHSQANDTCNGGACAQEAQYDTTLLVPACSGPTSSCDSGTLLMGRAQLGPEPHAPNTIANSCADGTSGYYQWDQSLDRLLVTTLDGSPLAPGKTARVDATIWAYSPADALDLYYAADASSPSWVFLTTLPPTRPGSQVLSTTYVLPGGIRQAIRGVYRYGGSASLCGSGDYDDRDDLVFWTDVPADTQPPTVSVTTPTDWSTVGGNVTVQANATDDVGVSRVDFYAQPITGGPPTLIGSDTTAPYSVVWNSLQVQDYYYLLFARARDFVGQETASSSITVKLDKGAPNLALTAPTDNSSVSGVVTLSAHAEDSSGIDRVSFYVDNQLVGTVPGQPSSSVHSLSWDSASVATGLHTVKATAWDKHGTSATTSDVYITVGGSGSGSGTVQAVYSSTWRTPACGSPGSGCDSGSLLLGRANLGPEANAPNTLGGTCADGRSGTFRYDESLDRLWISTLDGGNLRAGATVRVNATVLAYGSADVLDIYYASSAASPTWTFAGSVVPSISGQQTLSVSYTLPAGSTTQVVRGVFRYYGSRTSCSSGAYDDNDDLVFTVE